MHRGGKLEGLAGVEDLRSLSYFDMVFLICVLALVVGYLVELVR
jgi:hypothetical protein